MSYVTKKFSIQGVAPLLMHNNAAVDPKNALSIAMKKITAKKKNKTESDLDELARLEFLAGLYYTDKSGPYIPGINIEAMIKKAAKTLSKGPKVDQGVLCDEGWALKYRGPRDASELYSDDNFVHRRVAKVGQASVTRTRPQFREWELDFAIQYLPNIINEADLEEFVKIAGAQIGLGDWRPRHGRFIIAEDKSEKDWKGTPVKG